jgi:hypothetical protein
MRVQRLLVAFVAGVCLYEFAVVFCGGILAAVGVPPGYFSWFGPSRRETALALLQLVGFALPVGLLVAAGTFWVQRWFGARQREVLSAVLAGLVACFLFEVAVSLLVVAPGAPADRYPPSVMLRQQLLLPWWALSGALAPWIGFAAAAWFTGRKRLS